MKPWAKIQEERAVNRIIMDNSKENEGFDLRGNALADVLITCPFRKLDLFNAV